MANYPGQSSEFNFVFNNGDKNHADAVKWLNEVVKPLFPAARFGTPDELMDIAREKLTVIKNNFGAPPRAAWSTHFVSQNEVDSIEMGDEDPEGPKAMNVNVSANQRAFAIWPIS